MKSRNLPALTLAAMIGLSAVGLPAASEAGPVTWGSWTAVTYSALVIGVQPAEGGDTTPPAWIATWPIVDQLSPTSLLVRACANETGTAYFVVLAYGAAAPSAVRIKAGKDSTNAPALKSGSLALTYQVPIKS